MGFNHESQTNPCRQCSLPRSLSAPLCAFGNPFLKILPPVMDFMVDFLTGDMAVYSTTDIGLNAEVLCTWSLPFYIYTQKYNFTYPYIGIYTYQHRYSLYTHHILQVCDITHTAIHKKADNYKDLNSLVAGIAIYLYFSISYT